MVLKIEDFWGYLGRQRINHTVTMSGQNTQILYQQTMVVAVSHNYTESSLLNNK